MFCKADLIFLLPHLIIQEVHVDIEGDVLHHDQAVSHSNTSKNNIDGVHPHVLVGQHQHVHHVEDCSQQAD